MLTHRLNIQCVVDYVRQPNNSKSKMNQKRALFKCWKGLADFSDDFANNVRLQKNQYTPARTTMASSDGPPFRGFSMGSRSKSSSTAAAKTGAGSTAPTGRGDANGL